MKVLVINCGSSSLKYQLIDSETEAVLAKGLCERIGIDGRFTHTPAGREKFTLETYLPDHKAAITVVLKYLTDPEQGVIASLDEIGAVGHRVVHGGERFHSAVVIDDTVIQGIQACNFLAPLHNPANVTGIQACMAVMPDVPQIAVFDTAFHQTMPERAYLYAISNKFYTDYGVRRYGFHGTSHRYVANRTAELLGKDIKDTKIVVCHMGNGASLCAVDGGRSIDTSMGMTPLAGVAMGTRSGDVDPSVIEFLSERLHKPLRDIMTFLNNISGVYGLSGGISSDFRDLMAAKDQGNGMASTAIEVYCYDVVKYIGAYIAAMNGLDAIAFTAGVGENTPFVRERIASYLGYMGIYLDYSKNEEMVHGKEGVISKPECERKLLVVPTNEELMICRETIDLLNADKEG